MSKNENVRPKRLLDIATEKINNLLDESNVFLSSEDRGKIAELTHAIHLMNGKSINVKEKAGTKLVELENIIKSNPQLGINANKLLSILTEIAPDPETRDFINKNYFDKIRDQYAQDSKNRISSESTSVASDSVIFSPKNYSKSGRDEDIDPIIQAIRDEILSKQKLLLQNEIAKGLTSKEKENFLEEDFSAFRYYLSAYPGNQTIDDLVKRADLLKELHEIEREGYHLVHAKFKDNFYDVDWGRYNENNVRSTDVRHDDGSLACVLNETTISADAREVRLSNGKKQVINQYRKIDFPQELESGNGPMHASMAVMDINGNNISEDEAVYFTAHYNSSGKLMEISSPAPVRFAGRGDDAIGYVEINNRVFTIPVTKGKYIKMMQEIARNNNIDRAQGLLNGEVENISAIENTSPILQLTGIESVSVNNIEDIENIRNHLEGNIKSLEQDAKKEHLSPKEQAELTKTQLQLKEQVRILDKQSDQLTKAVSNAIDPNRLQEMVAKMRTNREARGNKTAEPQNLEKKAITVLPFAEMAEKMRASRKARGNETAEPLKKNSSNIVKDNLTDIQLEPIQISLPKTDNKKKKNHIHDLLKAAQEFNNALQDLNEVLRKEMQLDEKKMSQTVDKPNQNDDKKESMLLGDHTKYVLERKGKSNETKMLK